jgi:hypothetical protein
VPEKSITRQKPRRIRGAKTSRWNPAASLGICAFGGGFSFIAAEQIVQNCSGSDRIHKLSFCYQPIIADPCLDFVSPTGPAPTMKTSVSLYNDSFSKRS